MTSQQMRFDGEVVIVAGGGGAIGGAAAQQFAARGAKIVVNDISESAHAVCESINAAGGTAIASIASTATEAKLIVQTALDAFGRIDVVLNTTGLTHVGLFHTIAPEDWDRVFDSHFTSTLGLARAAWAALSASGNGRLINSSSTTIFGGEYSSTYIAPKGAIFAVGRAWALEGRSQNIRVNTIMPTAISQMNDNLPDPELVRVYREHFQPEKVAGFLGWLAHKTNTLSGHTFVVGGGQAAHVYLAEAQAVSVANPECPEAWAEHAAALTSKVQAVAPDNVVDEMRLRLESMGLPTGNLTNQAGWAPQE
ncbi:MAG: family NAD(P)-dependent oxidoreductase [Rhodospirillales bacterium]|nr:family NAD(P)-dependent oxidoreductase [Rhodospirillales bacterium]